MDPDSSGASEASGFAIDAPIFLGPEATRLNPGVPDSGALNLSSGGAANVSLASYQASPTLSKISSDSRFVSLMQNCLLESDIP